MSWPARLKRASRGKIYFCTKEKSGLQPILSAKSGNIQHSNENNTKMKKQINPTIKAHLIRGAFYLLLLLAVCAIPFALAQRNTTKRSMAQLKTAPAMVATAAARSGAPASLAGMHSKAVSQSKTGSRLRPDDIRRLPGVAHFSSATQGRSPVGPRTARLLRSLIPNSVYMIDDGTAENS